MTAIMAAWLSSIAVLSRLVRVANCSASVFNPSRNAVARWARRQERRALQAVLGEIDHDRDGLLDRVDVPSRFVGGVGRERQIEGVGGDEAAGERLARLSERGQQQGVAPADGALDDGVEPGHLPGRLEHLVLVGMRDRGLHLAHLAEALQEPFGHPAQLVGRPRHDGIDGAAVAQGAEDLAVQPQDFGEHLLARLIDIAMDQVLQAARLAFELDQQLVGFAHLPHFVPGAAEHVGAVPDQRGEDDGDDDIERGDREQAPPDRQHPDDALGLQVKASPRPRTGRGGSFILEGDQIETHWTWRIRSINCRKAASVTDFV